MKLIKNILVAVDFKDSTENIIENAISFARKFNAKITLFHALPSDIENEKVSSLVRKAAEEELEKISSKIKQADIEVADSILEFGDYSERIAYTANKSDANLIFIGAGEKQNKDAYQLGTTAGKVIRKSHKPVFVLKKNQKLDHIETILCPVDFSKESSNALKNAIAMTRLFDAKLIVLSVYSKFSNTNISRISPDEVNAQRKTEQEIELKRFLEEHNMVNLNYTTEIRGGSPSDEILKFIKENSVDLLFIGTTGKSGISKILLGSVAEKVTREVLCSFVTSKKTDFLHFEMMSQSLEGYYTSGQSLLEKGFYQEAINMFNEALDLNFSHVPSLKGLAIAYKHLGEKDKASKYDGMVKDILKQFENFRIEEEIRNNVNK